MTIGKSLSLGFRCVIAGEGCDLGIVKGSELACEG